MAFERSGSRLYEAFITKCETVLPASSLGFLYEIHQDEVRHFQLLKEALETLGADPTAITPCADVVGVASMGLIQVVNDPRTDVMQSALAILTAELVDNDGWMLLVNLAKKAGLAELAGKSQEAHESEERHLTQIRSWLNTMVLANDVVVDEKINEQAH